MIHFIDTLERLALTFGVKDVMVLKEELVKATNDITALQRLKEYPDFDVIPIVRNGKIRAYLERKAEKSIPIHWQDIISDSTSILDLVDLLQEHKFCFVLSKDDVAGYVHFSDLNKGVVKLPYFLILEVLERHLVDKVSPLLSEDDLGEVLDSERTRKIKERMRRMKRNRSNLGWVNLLTFNEIVRFACYYGILKLKQRQIEVMSSVRNAVFHADRALVEKHEDVRRLAEAKNIYISILNAITVKDHIG